KAAFNDGTLPGKPEPDIYLKACANIGADIKSTIVFEDSPAGIEAARRAGAGLIIRIALMKQFSGNNIAAATLKDFTDIKQLLKLAGLDA
nr:HAD family hydrolase [bacterium]